MFPACAAGDHVLTLFDVESDDRFFTLVALGAAGLANIPLLALVAVLVPIVAGFILGNLDQDIRNFLKPGLRPSRVWAR